MKQSAKDRWNANHYKQMKFSTPHLIAESFKSACEERKNSMASVIIKFMRDYSESGPAAINEHHKVKASTRRTRRKELRTVIDMVTAIYDVELGSLERIPENFRDSDAYAGTENIVEALETAIEVLKDVYPD